MSLLEMKHIKKEFSGVSVIRDISFSVEQGEILAIIGPSGSGKSTLLRCATMLETIENGEILYMGKKAVWTENGKLFLAKKQQRREIESCFGLVFQNFNLLEYMTAAENVELISELPALPILEKVGLSKEEAKRNVKQLSGGQQQRVAVARALASERQLLLADEPTGNLDEEMAKEITLILKESAHTHGKCVIVVTHSLELASEADIVISLKNGKLVNKQRE